MDPTHARDVLRHLEKQNELLQEAHIKMDHEMHKLQVEQEMLMRKFYQVMTTLDQTKKGEGTTNAATATATVDDDDDVQTKITKKDGQ